MRINKKGGGGEGEERWLMEGQKYLTTDCDSWIQAIGRAPVSISILVCMQTNTRTLHWRAPFYRNNLIPYVSFGTQCWLRNNSVNMRITQGNKGVLFKIHPRMR